MFPLKVKLFVPEQSEKRSSLMKYNVMIAVALILTLRLKINLVCLIFQA